MITAYAPNDTDYSTLGLGALTPVSATVAEQARGLYELTLVQPFERDNRDTIIMDMGVLRAPAPVRENPFATDTQGSVTRSIYKASKALKIYSNERANKSTGTLKKGAQAAVVASSGAYSRILTLQGGVLGWVQTSGLTFVKTQTETISGDTPGAVVRPVQSRDQLFRVYGIERDSEARRLTVRANHISYDLAGYLISGTYEAKKKSAAVVCAELLAHCDREVQDFHIICKCTNRISADYSGRSLLNALLDPDDGVAALCNARVVRDNFDFYILPDEVRNRGVEIRYGKNLKKAVLSTDSAGIITRIQPVGKKKNGDELLAPLVNSPYMNNYPIIRTARKQYDIKVGEDGITTESQALTALAKAARDDFAAGIDLAAVKLDTSFVRLELAREYRDLADYYNLHLYDTVPVIDLESGIEATVRMTGYSYNCLLDKYDDTDLGDMEDVATVQGFEIAGGSISGSKLMAGSVDGDRIRNLSIGYAKIMAAAIEQLNADSITANSAYIKDLAAGTVKADELVAALATITALHVEKLTAGDIEADRLAAALARFGVITAGNAAFDEATVRHLISSALQVENAVGGKVTISNLAVDYASIVSARVANLVIKASDGNYYKLDINSAGEIAPVLQTVTDAEAINGQTSGGMPIIETDMNVSDLSASNIRAAYALINRIDAARIDVDTLSARQAFINVLQTADLVSNSTLNAYLVNHDTEIDDLGAWRDAISRWIRFDDDGLTQGKEGSIYSTLIDEKGFHIRKEGQLDYVGSFDTEGLSTDGIRMGRIRVKKTSTGGWAWQEVNA